MTKVTQLPGLKDAVHDAQRMFRALLEALAHPGTVIQITAEMTVPQGLKAACGAACLTLSDLDVVVWLQPSFAPQVKDWLLFHTGCRFTRYPEEADFALIQDLTALPQLSIFNWGTAEKPEASTTLLIQVESFEMGLPMMLTGPGISTQRVIAPMLPPHFWDFWGQNHQAYPQGMDVFLFTENALMGLPRTTKSEVHHDS